MPQVSRSQVIATEIICSAKKDSNSKRKSHKSESFHSSLKQASCVKMFAVTPISFCQLEIVDMSSAKSDLEKKTLSLQPFHEY